MSLKVFFPEQHAYNLIGSGNSSRWADVDSTSDACTSMIKRWLETCKSSHERCTGGSETALPTRVLDVSNNEVRLRKTAGKSGSYLTLSHCWGLEPILTTTPKTLHAHLEQVPWDPLPQNFKDAITLIRKLGFKYVWIDSLCIIQGDKQDWEIESSRMADIYRGSSLTIAATRSPESRGGCFSDRSKAPLALNSHGFKLVKEIPEIWEPRFFDGHDISGEACQYWARVAFPHELSAEKAVGLPLLKRAWVFQERTLSPRMIHFTPNELYWECTTISTCECTEVTSSTNGKTRPNGIKDALHVMTTGEARTEPLHGTPQREMWAWQSLVKEYSSLALTQPLDRLPALSGIASLMPEDKYLAGLWHQHLPLQLIWRTYPSSSRRAVPYRAPSWSWASVDSSIWFYYDDADKVDSISTIIEASSESEGLDPRGRVSSAVIVMKGPSIDAVATNVDKNPPLLTVCSDDLIFTVALDLSPFEVSNGDVVTLIAITTHYGLALLPSETDATAFRRVGMCWSDTPNNFALERMDEKVVTIV